MPRIARMSAPDRRWPMSPHVHIDDGSPPPPGSAGPAGGPEACTPVQITDNVVRAVDPGPQPSPRAVLVKEAPHATGPRPSILKQGQAPPRQRHSVGSSQAKSEGYSFGSAAPSDGGGGTRDSFHRRISRMSHSSMRVLRRKTWHNMSGDNLRWYEFVVIISLSVSLAVMAGLINAVSLLSALEMTVSHVTGLVTKGAVSVVKGNFMVLVTNLGIFFSFVLGAFTAGLFAEGETWRLGRRYGILMLIESGALWLGYALYFTPAQRATVFINAFACGLQNALGTRYSGAIVRTTHLTGAATDIGTVLAHRVRYGSAATDTWRLKFLVPLTVGYFLGALGGGVLFVYMEYHAMTIPAAFIGLVGLVYLVMRVLAGPDDGAALPEVKTVASHIIDSDTEGAPSSNAWHDSSNRGLPSAADVPGHVHFIDTPRIETEPASPSEIKPLQIDNAIDVLSEHDMHVLEVYSLDGRPVSP